MRAGFQLVLACLFLAQVASAQTWQFDYDPALGTKPSDQGWTHGLFDPLPDDGLSESNYVVALGVLAQGDTGGPNTDPANLQYYELSPPSFDFDTDVIVVDLRLTVLFSTVTPLGSTRTTGFSVVVEDDGGEFVTLFVGSAELFLKGHGSGVGISLVIPFDSTLAYADYQLRIDGRGASVLVDGSVLVTLGREGFGSHVGAGKVTIGDRSGTERSASQLQSIRVSRFNPPAAQVHNYETDTFVGGSNSSSTKAWTLPCPAGKQALGGGVETIDADGSVGLTDSRPSGGPPATSWYGAARELVDTDDSWQIRVDVLCGEISGYEMVSPVPQAPHTTAAHKGAQVDCDDRGKVVVSGGGGFAGADLRQALTNSIAFFPFTEFELDWGVGVHDYGAAVSSGAWGVEVDAICTDALLLEPTSLEDAQGPGSPRQLPHNCTSGKVPISGGASIKGWAGGEAALRASRPKDSASPGSPPVGWFANAQVDSAPLWNLEVGLTCAPIADPTVSKTGLISRFKGDDAGFDSWGFGHGTLENGVGFVPGILGQGSSFSFDGVSDQWVNIPSDICCGEFNSHDLYPEASFSVGAWIETAVVPTGEDALIVGLHDGGGLNPGGFNQSAWSLRLQPGGAPLAAFRDDVGGSSTLAGPGPDNLADGALHHVAMVRDLEAGQFRLYVDGLLEDEESIQTGVDDGPLEPGNVLSPDPVAIGIWRDGGATTLGFPFDGLIDDVKYYDRALSEEEIQNTAGCSFPLVPRVLNLDAALFGNPAGGDPGLCVFLEAGDYRATLVNPALDPNARLTAWSPSATATWSTAYVVEPEVDGSSAGGFAAGSATPQLAFDATTVKELDFTLSVDQRVHFSMVDDAVLDNRGGISIKLEDLPEPSFGTGVAAGAIVLGLLSRRRSGRVAARADAARP